MRCARVVSHPVRGQDGERMAELLSVDAMKDKVFIFAILFPSTPKLGPVV